MERPARPAKEPAEEEIPSAVEVPDQPLGAGPEERVRDGAEEDFGERMPGIPTDGEPPAAS